MFFRDLYRLVEQQEQPPIRFETLRHLINTTHSGVGEINVWAIKYPQPNHQAHYIMLGTDRTSPYEEEFKIAEIRYCEELDKHPRTRRFALTKELMHVFDSESEMTNTREKFIQLTKEIQNQPLPQHASDMFKAELGTKWMALIVLCPRPLRNKYFDRYHAREIEGFEVAEKLALPEWIVPYIMDDYYDDAFDALMIR